MKRHFEPDDPILKRHEWHVEQWRQTGEWGAYKDRPKPPDLQVMFFTGPRPKPEQ